MRKIWNTVLKGLVAILPLGLTVYVVYWLAVTAERLFSKVIKLLVPEPYYWPGLGLLIGLVVLYFVGLAVNAYFVGRALRMSDELFARIPVVKTIYLAIRDFMRFFPSSGQGSDLRRVVLVQFGPGKVIGFVTAESDEMLRRSTPAGDDMVAVYLPMSYMVGGYTIFLPRELVETTALSVEEGMRIALMGGVRSSATSATPDASPRQRTDVQAVVIPVTPFAQNCSLVWCPRTLEGAVIDPGGDLEKVLAEAKKHGVKLTKILLTHAHIDHAGGTAKLARDLQLPIIGPHPGDQFWIDGIAEQGRMFGFGHCESFVPDQWLDQGDKVKVGDVEFDVQHCPGHTPGHVTFHCAADKIAFVGDVLFAGFDRPHRFPGRRLRHADPLDS